MFYNNKTCLYVYYSEIRTEDNQNTSTLLVNWQSLTCLGGDFILNNSTDTLMYATHGSSLKFVSMISVVSMVSLVSVVTMVLVAVYQDALWYRHSNLSRHSYLSLWSAKLNTIAKILHWYSWRHWHWVRKSLKQWFENSLTDLQKAFLKCGMGPTSSFFFPLLSVYWRLSLGTCHLPCGSPTFFLLQGRGLKLIF